MPDINFKALADPFPPGDIDWRPGRVNKDKTKAMALAYLDARAVMDRLDEVCGPERWQDTYVVGPQGGLICRLSIRVNGEWVTKEDGAENTDVEAVKGGLSDALKRAAVKWGIGRYLYSLPRQWCPCESYGKSVVLKGRPRLPDWALPSGVRDDRPSVPADDGEEWPDSAPEMQHASDAHPPAAQPVAQPAPEPEQPAAAESRPARETPYTIMTALMMEYRITSRPMADHLGEPFSERALLRYLESHPSESPQSIADTIRRKLEAA